ETESATERTDRPERWLGSRATWRQRALNLKARCGSTRKTRSSGAAWSKSPRPASGVRPMKNRSKPKSTDRAPSNGQGQPRIVRAKLLVLFAVLGLLASVLSRFLL